ncbi:hypothetical protein MPTK1_3g18460 [Marchantia polymorpha subsp. ruderalis]|uniref:C-terminal of Roc (COR) domain-containing protein n=1 Tax=Marchantia polymorpha subsp. ruderalis TaxID=1480154 RepID=A0AAF6B275_MARPO|nr:hypothetical protein Mp_3g18460 [Marchantia polymorpha subsp. ruderalis]
MASSESPSAQRREKLRDLVRRLEHTSAQDDSVEYENVVRMCVEQVQGIRSINDLSGLQSREAETLLDVLRWADISKLRELDLSKTLITGSVVQILSDVLSTTRFAALEVLNLSENLHCQMDMTSSAALAEVLAGGCLPHLRVLCLPPCHVPTIAAAMLRGNISRLEELRMEFYRKLMQSSSELKNFFEEGALSALRILGLRDCISTEDQIEQFMRRVKSGDLMKLECLDFSNNFLNYKGCKFLARAIQSGQLCQLRHLDLSWCKLGDSGVQQILDGIDQTPLLETLCLESNSFTDVATASLAQAMKKRKLVNIRKIRVHGRNMISNQGIVALSTVLSDSTCVPKLDTLDFGEDKTLDLIGAKALRDAYRQNPNLTVFVNVSWPDESLKIQMQEQRVNNMRAEEFTLTSLDEEQVVPRMAKVFICGYEKVGKTTLRRSMERNLLKSLIKWERRHRFHEEPRTRGIELSAVSGEAGTSAEELTLILWDLAGQQEFHVMHGAFLPDLGLASGKATTFLLVFRTDLVKLPEAAKSERELRYWLRFIAAGSVKGIKRHLVLALNCIDSRIHGGVEAKDFKSQKTFWGPLLKDVGEAFSDSLDIHSEPFVVDARSRKSVQELKQHLLSKVENALKDVKIPKLCLEIHEFLLDWKSKHSNFPVLNWTLFSQMMEERGIKADKLDAATAHLQETGCIIYYRNSPVGKETDRFVVADPEWFGRKVIGEILLPEQMLAAKESSLSQIVGDDGSLKRSMLAGHFQALNKDSANTDELIDMLAKLGLCYDVGKERVFIPALIREDNLSKWERKGVHWVMGRSLQPREEDKGFIPSSVFRKLQVLLAQDKKFGLQGSDSDYCAGKTFSFFMVGSQMVLVQFDVDESDPGDDRIDVLVKRMVKQVDAVSGVEVEDHSYHTDLDLVLEIMDLVERLCTQTCPSVELERKAIGPWRADSATVPMAERKLIPVDELKMRVRKHGLHSSTTMRVGQVGVQNGQLLSARELEAIHSSVNESLLIAQSEIEKFDLLPPSSLPMADETEEALKQDETQGDTALIISVVQKVVREEGQKIIKHIDRKCEELQKKFDKAFECQKKLLNQILALNRYSIEEKENCYPRYIFLAKEDDSRFYLSARQAFHERFRMHLLCECDYSDGVPHHVEKQEGLEIKNMREWLRKVEPCLSWTLKVTLITAKLVGNIVAPGLGLLIPNFDGGNMSKMADGVALVAKGAQDSTSQSFAEGAQETLSQVSLDSLGPRESVKELSATLVMDRIRELGSAMFYEKIKLKRVELSSSRESDPYSKTVVWMCDECFNCYQPTGRVRDITNYFDRVKPSASVWL